MARRFHRIVSIVLSAALVVLSVGFDAQQAAAQTLIGRRANVLPTPPLGLGATNAPSSLPAPAALTALPLAASPATTLAESIKAAAPALRTLAEPAAAVSAASVAGRDLEDAMTRGISVRASDDLSDAVLGVPSALIPALAAASSASEAPKTPAVPVAAPAPVKSIASAISYRCHRWALKAVAALTGAVFTLPQAGPALTAKIIASAADKALVLSDFDDTLAAYNQVLPVQKVAAILHILDAGKRFAVISDRGDVKRPGDRQLTVFDSLESIPAENRVGIYVAANAGGKIYRYDALGVPQKVHEAAGLEAEKLDAVKAAAAATKERLASVGAVQHVADGKHAAESYSTYGYAMMLKAGSSENSVRGAAAILAEELAKRGIEAEVNARFAKDPANPPYITFSIITKAGAAAYIAKALKIEARDALVIGDAMFVPREAKRAGWLARLGERLSGRPQAKTGNETDRNMARGLPGALTLGVGGSMDPRVPNGWALAGKGPEVTQKVLESVASKTRRPNGEAVSRSEAVLQLGAVALILGLGALGWYAFAHILGDIVRLGEEAVRHWSSSPFGPAVLLGTVVGAAGQAMREKLQTFKEAHGAAILAVPGVERVGIDDADGRLNLRIDIKTGTAGSIEKVILAVLKAVPELRTVPVTFRVIGPIDSLTDERIQLGHTRQVTISNPNRSYPQALKKALEIVTERGISADQVRFVEATASLPVRDGAQWKYAFTVPGALIYVDFSNFFGGAQDFRVSIYEGNVPSSEVEARALTADEFASIVGLDADSALFALRRELPGFGAGAAVSLASRPAQDGAAAQMSYRFYDDHGHIGTISARAPELTDADIRASAAGVIAYKGRPWSWTEYNASYYPALERLRSRGATKTQIALFERLCAEAPIKGGSFNPWSGD